MGEGSGRRRYSKRSGGTSSPTTPRKSNSRSSSSSSYTYSYNGDEGEDDYYKSDISYINDDAVDLERNVHETTTATTSSNNNMLNKNKQHKRNSNNKNSRKNSEENNKNSNTGANGNGNSNSKKSSNNKGNNKEMFLLTTAKNRGVGAPDEAYMTRDHKATARALQKEHDKFHLHAANQRMSAFERQRISRWGTASEDGGGDSSGHHHNNNQNQNQNQNNRYQHEKYSRDNPNPLNVKLTPEEWGYAYGPVPDSFTLPPVDDEMKERYGPDVQWTLNGDADVVRKRIWRRRSKKHQHELRFRHQGPQWRMRHRENYHKGLLNHFVYGGEMQKFRPYAHKYAARFRTEHGYPGNPVKYGYAIKPAARYVARHEGTWAPNPHWTLPPDRESREYYAMLDAEHIRHEPRDGSNGRKFSPYDPRLTYEERRAKDEAEGVWRAPLKVIRENRTWAPASTLRNLGPIREYDHPFWHYHPWALEKQRNAEMVTRADLKTLGYKNDPQFDPASERNHFYVPFNESRYSYKSFRRRAVERKRRQAEADRASWWGSTKRFVRKYILRDLQVDSDGDRASQPPHRIERIINAMIGPPVYSNYSATRLARQRSDNYYGSVDPNDVNGSSNGKIGRKYPFKRNFLSDDVLQWKREDGDDDHFDIEDDEDDPDLDDEYRDEYLGVPHLDRARKRMNRPKGWDPLVHWFEATGDQQHEDVRYDVSEQRRGRWEIGGGDVIAVATATATSSSTFSHSTTTGGRHHNHHHHLLLRRQSHHATTSLMGGARTPAASTATAASAAAVGGGAAALLLMISVTAAGVIVLSAMHRSRPKASVEKSARGKNNRSKKHARTVTVSLFS